MKKSTYTLSIDMLGSETKVKDIIKALNQSYLRNINYKFKLFGNKKEIFRHLIKYKQLTSVVDIIDC